MGRYLQQKVLGYVSSKRAARPVIDYPHELLEPPDSLLSDLGCACGWLGGVLFELMGTMCDLVACSRCSSTFKVQLELHFNATYYYRSASHVDHCLERRPDSVASSDLHPGPQHRISSPKWIICEVMPVLCAIDFLIPKVVHFRNSQGQNALLQRKTSQLPRSTSTYLPNH